jgi:hypothetical protein
MVLSDFPHCLAANGNLPNEQSTDSQPVIDLFYVFNYAICKPEQRVSLEEHIKK